MKEPTDFCFKYLIMCNQNPSEPKALPLLIPIIADKFFYFAGGGADQACLYVIFGKLGRFALFLSRVHSVLGSSQLIKI